MHSMTGYGRASVEIDGRQLTVELKSVNHRFLDIAIRQPRSLMFLEDQIRAQIGARVNRGHIEVFVTYRNLRTDARSVTVDRALFEAYAAALEGVSDLGMKDDRTLMGIARMPEVVTVSEADEDQQALAELMAKALAGALDGLVAMRAREGESICQDLSGRVDAIEAMTDEIEARYPQTVEAYKQRLHAAVQELLSDAADENRIMMEVVIMADRSAIDEETVRLRSHVRQLRALLHSEAPVGRRVDFLVQELNREVNTISSKSQDIPITRLTVDMKAEIEKLREQVQNVE